MDRIERLPLFPLELVFYPGETLALHIFEPKYKALASFCLKHDHPFGIVLYENDEDLARVGSTANIVEVVRKYEDGRMDLEVEGGERFEIEDVYEGESYLTADVHTLDEAQEPLERPLRERVITQHMKLLELAGRQVSPSLYENREHLSFLLAQNAGLDVQQKQHILEMANENSRLAFLIEHFEELLPQMEEQGELQRKVRSNGHFEDFPSSRGSI